MGVKSSKGKSEEKSKDVELDSLHSKHDNDSITADVTRNAEDYQPDTSGNEGAASGSKVPEHVRIIQKWQKKKAEQANEEQDTRKGTKGTKGMREDDNTEMGGEES